MSKPILAVVGRPNVGKSTFFNRIIGERKAIVEDIPGVALAEGVQWSWESFTDYMDALERTPRVMDYLVQVPHDPLRMYVMGERAVATMTASGTRVLLRRRCLGRLPAGGGSLHDTRRS